ncbi:MAG: DegT/DnrJ/EryC1/StrS family aminotransferase [Lysobacteraceae bacterium]|nr:MAG: DegT/DnrJ/EryC1/StrS family aminotransferase [Xanthomonadaceae bacterium]
MTPVPPQAIPVNSLQRHIQPMADRLAAAARGVIDSGHFVLGPHVQRFEQAFAAYCGVGHVVGVGNGTDALELSLRALGVGPGDRVAVVANAAMYGATAIVACGGTPVFVDINPETHTMCADALASTLESGPLKAVIVTHLYGRLAAMEALLPQCRDRGIPVVEDCAQAHGARDGAGIRAGAFGDIASFSFYPTKNLGALGDGGAVATSSPDLAERTRQLRQYGWTAKYTNTLAGGRNTRLDEMQAALLLEMLPELDGWNARRRAIANRYTAAIKTRRLVVPPSCGAEHVAHLYVVRCEDRDESRAQLAELGIQTDVHYPTPDYRQPCLLGKIDASPLPHTEADASSVMTLPCFPELTDAEVDAVIAACNRL